MSWWTPANQSYAYNYLVSAGLSPYGAAALVSRWANVESGSRGPFSVNPTSGAFGIPQWLGARRAGISGDANFDDQLAYVVQELNSTESRAGAVLRSAPDAYSGAVGASMYERAEGYNAHTGTDNFTTRTANGVASVLSAVGAPQPSFSSNANYDEGIQSSASNGQLADADFPSAGIGIGGVAVLGLALLFVVVVLGE